MGGADSGSWPLNPLVGGSNPLGVITVCMGGYPLAFNGSFSGEYELLKFEGDFDVQI